MGWCNPFASAAIVQASDTGLAHAQRLPCYAAFADAFAEDVPGLTLFARTGGTPAAVACEHTDFNLETYTQQADVTPGAAATLDFVDLHGSPGALAFPAGAVTQTVTARYTPLVASAYSRPDDLSFAGALRLGIAVGGVPQLGCTLVQPLTVTVTDRDADLFAIYDEQWLVLRYWDGGSWQDAAATCPPAARYQVLDAAHNRVEARLCRLGEFALLGARNYPLYLPALARARS